MGTDRETNGRGGALIHGRVTEKIIAAAFNVHNALGCGLLEKVYENALAWELELRGQKSVAQKEYVVTYRDRCVGQYFADLVVDNKVVVEVKTVRQLDDIHRAQRLNYLKVSGLRVGLLMNFANPRLAYERLVC